MAVTTGEWTKHLTAAADSVSNLIVQGFSFHSATAAGHECKVTDSTGKEVFDAKASAQHGGETVMLTCPKFFKTLTVATLTSGELIIYFI